MQYFYKPHKTVCRLFTHAVSLRLTCIQLSAKTEKGSSHNHCMYYYGEWHYGLKNIIKKTQYYG